MNGGTREQKNQTEFIEEEAEPRTRAIHSRTVFKAISYCIIASSLCSNLMFMSLFGQYLPHDVGFYHTSTKAPYSPAQQAVTYNVASVNTKLPNYTYGGPPGEGFDRAWSDLLLPTTIWTTAEELQRGNKRSIKIRDDERYVAYLEVYHQLHCIKRIVQYQWQERYPELVSTGRLSEKHFNHCIEVLRRGVMCNADASVNTWVWDSNSTHLVGVTDYPKKCVDWEKLDHWARDRATGSEVELLTADEDGFLGP